MSANPFVSIVIINWNGIRFIDKCIKSILSSTYKNIEIIVVDNGSTDGSPEYVSKKYPNVKLIKNARNLGYARACNIGIKYAKGDIVAILNNDVWVEASWLEPLIKMLSNPKIGVTGPVIVDSSNKVQNLGYLLHPSCYPIAVSVNNQHERLELDYISGAAIIARKETLMEVGGFDEKFFAFYEDADLCFRLKTKGYDCRICKSSKIYHIGSASWSKFRLWQFVTSENSRLRFIVKHFGLIRLLKSLLVYDIQYWVGRIIDVTRGTTKSQSHRDAHSLLKTALNILASRIILVLSLPQILSKILKDKYV